MTKTTIIYHPEHLPMPNFDNVSEYLIEETDTYKLYLINNNPESEVTLYLRFDFGLFESIYIGINDRFETQIEQYIYHAKQYYNSVSIDVVMELFIKKLVIKIVDKSIHMSSNNMTIPDAVTKDGDCDAYGVSNAGGSIATHHRLCELLFNEVIKAA